MASLNPLTRELVFKIVFYGPGLGGKTSTLQYIFEATKAEHRGKMVSLATPTDRTLYFDFLPLRMPRIRGMSVRLQLFTVPGQMYFAATRKLVLAGADGVVFVADSQTARADANRESLDDLRSNLREHGRELGEIPHTLLYNKRDLDETMPIEEMDRSLNMYGAPSRGSVATNGAGIFAGLEEITRRVLRAYEADLPRTSVPNSAGMPGSSAGAGMTDVAQLGPTSSENGLEEAIRGLTDRIMHPTPPRGISSVPEAAVPSMRQPPVAEAAAEPVDATRTDEASAPPPPVSAEALAEIAPSDPAPPPAPEVTNDQVYSAGFSLAPFWPAADRELVQEVEANLAAHESGAAILACEHLVLRALAAVAAPLGPDAPRDPASLALLIGLDGSRYLAFRTLVRRARRGDAMSEAPAYDALLFAAETVRVAANVQLYKR